jgi:membrane protease subunit HflK
MQKILDDYHAGVLVLQVLLLSVDPPQSVIAAFRDVTAAQQDLQRLSNEAEAYANRVVPEARGAAARILQESEAYREQTVAEARGQAARFEKIYEQYRNAPALTRERLYIETMERVLGGAEKVILDDPAKGGASVAPFMPLPSFAPFQGGPK